MSVLPQPPRRLERVPMAFDDYLALPESTRAEYVDGRAIVGPAPVGPHQTAARRVANLVEAGTDLKVFEAVGVWTGERRSPIPDVVATTVPVTDYDVYAPDDDVPWELREDGAPEPTAAGGWCVLVEVANGGQTSPPTRVVVVAEDFADRADAMAEARTQAFEYRPPDPVMPRLRQVFEDDDGFLTIVEGAMTTFHFRTRVMRLAGVV